MRKFYSVALLVSMVGSLAVSSFAQGIFVRPGSKANAAGGSTAATTGDVTALSSNPAALSALTGSGVMLTVHNFNGPVKASGAINGEFNVSALIPFIGAYRAVDDCVIAMGFYGVGGGGGKANNVDMGGLAYTVDGQSAYMAANVSASKKLSDELSAGLGIDILYKAVTQKLNVGGFQFPDSSSNGTGVQLNGGVLYQMSDDLKTGAVIRSGGLIRMKDSAESSEIFPVTYGVGADYAVMQDLNLSLGVDMQNYAAYVDKWKNVPVYHAGAIYQGTEKMYVGLGVQHDPSAVAPEDVPVPLFEINKFAVTTIMLGTGYDFGKFDVNA